MRLPWNQVRARTAAFAEAWQGAACKKGESQSFSNHFFRMLGVKRRTVARFWCPSFHPAPCRLLGAGVGMGGTVWPVAGLKALTARGLTGWLVVRQG